MRLELCRFGISDSTCERSTLVHRKRRVCAVPVRSLDRFGREAKLFLLSECLSFLREPLSRQTRHRES